MKQSLIFSLTLLAGLTSAATIEPTWESMAANYKVPEWFKDGKIGVWMHWGISSAVDENRPNDGSWYGRNMYGGGKKIAKALKAPVEIMIIRNAGHNWRRVDADIEPSRDVINERTVQFFVDHP